MKKYLSTDAPARPPAAPSPRGSVERKVDAVAPLIHAWLRADRKLKASVIHERLVAEHGFDCHHQRVKLYIAETRERLAAEDSERGELTGPAGGQPGAEDGALPLAIVSMALGIPLTAVAGAAMRSVLAVLIVWIGIVGVNLAYGLSRRARR